jgi:hypothetical protein
MIIRCYNCGYDGLTRVAISDGCGVWATCIICCVLGCCICAPCVFCIDSLKDVHHYCGSCQTLVAMKKTCQWLTKNSSKLIYYCLIQNYSFTHQLIIIPSRSYSISLYFLVFLQSTHLGSSQMDVYKHSLAFLYFPCRALVSLI